MDKPRILLDIKHGRFHSFSRRTSRLNLSQKTPTLRLLTPLKAFFAIAVIASSIGSFAIAPNSSGLFAAQDITSERAALEQQLADLERQMAEYQDQIDTYRSQGNSLKSEVDRLNSQIAKLNTQIKAINLSLAKLGREIQDNEGQISDTETRLQQNLGAISQALRYVYESDQESLVAVLLKNPNLSEFFKGVNNLLDVQNSLSVKVQEMNKLKLQLLDEKEALALRREDVAALKAFQDAQKKNVLSAKSEKDKLLEVTKGKESEYKKLYEQTAQTAAQIRSRIFQLLGGGEMTFGDAYGFAKYAEGAVGVRAAFLLAILDRESALGRNVGQCNYQEAMAPGPPLSRRDDISPFLQIMAELGMDPNSVKVSCPISQDGAYGGGMGPAQFIPTTWIGYKDRIAAVTGSHPPSPWRNSDAFVATALYLKDALNACDAYSGTSQERCAAARYYAGGNWQRFLFTYGDRVISRAAQFEEDIKVLNS